VCFYFSVEELMELEDETVALSRSYWWATVAALTAGLLLTTLAAILAALNTAVTPASALSGVPGLYLFNILASKYFKNNEKFELQFDFKI
jgi:hypothetical protein